MRVYHEKKSDGVRVDHEIRSDRMRVDHKKGVRVYHKKGRWGESSP